MGLSYIDIFCGAGGSSVGLTEAGLELMLAANHWQTAINTHAANFPGAEHLCADVNNYDMRRLPKADVLWASPICTEISPAGGNAYESAQEALFDDEAPLPKDAFERTRATCWDVIRATEVWRYKAVLVENVVELATKWQLFRAWLHCMEVLGYQHQVVSASSAHVGGPGNPHAAQWRDRIYVVFLRKGIKMPDLAPRPLAWCFDCGELVEAVQVWRRGAQHIKIGKYGQQYDYACPHTNRRHTNPLVEPFVRPAASIIDWTYLGAKIGERKRPLAQNTINRVRAGLRMVMDEPQSVLVTLNHGGDDARAMLPDRAPLPTRTIKLGEALVTPMVLPVGGPNHDQGPTYANEPLRARLTRDTDAVVTAPFIAELRNNCSHARVSDPISTLNTARHHAVVTPEPSGRYADAGVQEVYTVTVDNQALVLPYRKGAKAFTPHRPLHTLGTHDSGAVINVGDLVAERRMERLLDQQVLEAHLRMLQPRESLAAQRFPDDYIMTGTKGEQTKQAGNAVSSNVAHHIGAGVKQALDAA